MAKKSIFKAMEKFLSKDTSRGALNGYYVEIDGELATITATNGHVLCSHIMELESLKTEMLNEFRVLPNDDAKEFIIFANKKLNKPLYDYDEKYPKYKNIIPNVGSMTLAKDLTFHIMLNPGNSKIVCDAKKYFGMYNSACPFDMATTKLGACLSKDDNTTILIMPLRIVD